MYKTPKNSDSGLYFGLTAQFSLNFFLTKLESTHVHGSQDHDLDPDLSDLDMRSQGIINLSLCFVEKSTGILDPTNHFVGRSPEIIDLHFFKILPFSVFFKQMM